MEISPSMFFLFFTTLIFNPLVSTADTYSQALMSLKSELKDDYSSLEDWILPSGENPSGKIYACSWSGVRCDKNSTVVTGLDLSRKSLAGSLSGKQFTALTELVDLNLSHNSFSGKLPVEMFNLSNLRSMDISRNNFSGQFPAVSGLLNLVVLDAFSNSFSGPLPGEVSQLEHLKVLNLAGSYFSGPIPSEYGSFKSLEFIHLAGNLLSGSIPPELGKLKTVTHMEIGYNTYQGSIPWEMGNMSELQYLDIAGANLSGSIPKEFGNLTKLHSLFLFRNLLIGRIPGELSRITSLTSLDLSDNQISGPIPESFARLKNLKLLSLFYNDMDGTIPEGIAELPSLDTLLIWNNYFTGSLPQSLGRNSDLKWVDVSTNNFLGGIPPAICAKGILYKLLLFSNNFSGGLSPISNCSSLVRLRLEDNSIVGEIPLKFGLLPDITYVDLSRNNLTGGIPTDIRQASKLQYFNISNNPKLGGRVPAKIWSLPLLQNFSASSCNISGNLPPFQSCKSISVIELETNNLLGKIPESISSCHALVRLNLANNNLEGSIPEKLGNLPRLSVLDLSDNNFNGSIPAKLSGAFEGNSELCGEPLHSCTDSVAILGHKGKGRLIWVLLLCALMVMFVSAFILGIVYVLKLSNGRWKMVSFTGLPQFTANDILRSFSSTESIEVPPLSTSVCKTVLPTGITVSVKKIEWEAKRMRVMSEFIRQIGNARHKNLVRLLGFCYNKNVAYLLHDNLPNGNLADKIRMKMDWAAKYKLVNGIAEGLCFLHHDCYPAIAHGDLKSANIAFDENMEPQLIDFGLKYLIQSSKDSCPTLFHSKERGEFNTAIKEDLYVDIFNFGKIVFEVLTNGSLTNAGESIENKPVEILLKELHNENEVRSNGPEEQIKLLVEVALLCTRTRPSDRPSMEDVLRLLSGLKPQRKQSF